MTTIAFVEANPPNLRGRYTKCNDFEPYGLESLAAISNKEGFGIKILQQNEMSNEELVQEILNNSPDIVAFSCMTYNFNSSLELARTIKQNHPNTKIIVGGPHISSFPQGLEEAIRTSVIDFGVKGEADLIFNELVKKIESPDLNLPGLIYKNKNNGAFTINPSAERIHDLDALPFAFRSREILKRTKAGRIMNPSQTEQISTATLAYSRGCPFSCAYCDSRNIWGKRVVWRSASNVVREIKELKEEYGVNALFFSDLTFNSNPKKVEELCNELINNNVDISWYALARVAIPDGTKTLIDRDLLEIMYKAGCRKIGYGLESIVPEIQKGFRKIISNETIAGLVEEGHRIGILNKGFIILGEPEYELPATIEKTLEVLKRIKFDEIRISFLTPFPGSELYKRVKKEGLLLTDDLSSYTTDEPVIRCTNFSPDQLVEARRYITSAYYQSQEYQKLVSEKITKFPELKKPYEEHHSFLRENNFIR